MEEPVYGAMYLKPAGSLAGAATIVVYYSAPCASSVPPMPANVVPIWPIAT
jgi:hypothetical protein